ncbi:NADH dehydrogenase [ubiquinone] 1 alpha subcomplex assembly factor 3 isoform X2 [Onychostoma macrolepis]|uniref:NADH dehydrogenase [ubiquinone] 1 alpha subcomplex assembly factor 3 isoform X2 n=1 Tax=Onychostoma macrolepis TaxID=369639 RepID=UPI002729FE16|nr:NADH dehydrogenase [ubiquinone] 1 alpha subcomplex assembly factor 3 isoform X2 [Onychostoma macrolepis]
MAAASCARLLSAGSVHGLRLGSRLLPALSRVCPVRGHRLGPADDELYQRTTVTLMQKNAAAGAVIYSYSPRGFNISGNTVLGPCAVLPPSILQWNVGCHTDITVESLSLFYLLEPRVDCLPELSSLIRRCCGVITRAGLTEVLVLGTGARTERLDPSVLRFLKTKGIAVEVQDTPNACATFNFLSSEGRLAAAGLIPPPASE